MPLANAKRRSCSKTAHQVLWRRLRSEVVIFQSVLSWFRPMLCDNATMRETLTVLEIRQVEGRPAMFKQAAMIMDRSHLVYSRSLAAEAACQAKS